MTTSAGQPLSLANPLLLGITAGNWRRLLGENGFTIEPGFRGRAAFTSAWSLINSCFGRQEARRYDPALRDVQVAEAPLFVLGHWRSGTTYLRHLLALDRAQFACPSYFQVAYPHTFLSTEQLITKRLAGAVPRTRLVDNMRFDWHTPGEDEVALLLLSRCSPYLALVFPRRRDYYERYLTLRGVAEGEIARWKEAFVWFVRKLTFKHGRTLLLKSPTHTARIRLLLEIFPTARFVHIRRNPYTVFQSSLRLRRMSNAWLCLQRPVEEEIITDTLRQYRLLNEAYFEERALIPEGQLHEVAFEDLERDPAGQIEAIYGKLGLAGFEAVKPKLAGHLTQIASYQKNAYPELPAELRRMVAREWRQTFEAWQYPF